MNVELFFFKRISWAARDPTHSDTSLHSRSTSNKVLWLLLAILGHSLDDFVPKNHDGDHNHNDGDH